MYKDKEKQRAAARERKRRQRDKGVTKVEGVTALEGKGVTSSMRVPPDILDKLTDKVWRPKLEKLRIAFEASHYPSNSEHVRLGDTLLSDVFELLECTG